MVRVASWSVISVACAFPDESGLLQTRQVRVAELTSPPRCSDGDVSTDPSGCCTALCENGNFGPKLCQDCQRRECPEGQEIVEVPGVCCPGCTPINCAAKVDNDDWTDGLFGDGDGTCQDMVANPRWCRGRSGYSRIARLACPESCNVCESCQDEFGWRDNLAGGDGESTCQDMVANPNWCTDYGRYSKIASLACPVSCKICPAPPPPPACCRAFTAACLSCSTGQTEEEFCRENPGTSGCPQLCHELNGCEACLAAGCASMQSSCSEECAADAPCWRLRDHGDSSVEDVCALKDQAEQDFSLCASKSNCGDCTQTLQSDNHACQWFEDGFCAGSSWWSQPVESCEETSRLCCKALTATCMSCDADQTEEEFCADPENADVMGCGHRA